MEIESNAGVRVARLKSTGEVVLIGDPEKMSKSKKNTVAPADIADVHGVDAARLFVLSDSPPDRDVQWTSSGVEGASRLLQRVWAEFDALDETPEPRSPDDLSLARITHRAVKAITEAIDGFRFNSAIARIYEFSAAIRNARSTASITARRDALSALARVIAPFAPHLAEECWRRMGETRLIAFAPWPDWDPALVVEDQRVLPVQINGKRRGEIVVPAGASSEMVERLVLADPEISGKLEGLAIRKVIVVPDRIVNLVAA